MKLMLFIITAMTLFVISSSGYTDDGCPDKTRFCCESAIIELELLKNRISENQQINIDNQNLDENISDLKLLKKLKRIISTHYCE